MRPQPVCVVCCFFFARQCDGVVFMAQHQHRYTQVPGSMPLEVLADAATLAELVPQLPDADLIAEVCFIMMSYGYLCQCTTLSV